MSPFLGIEPQVERDLDERERTKRRKGRSEVHRAYALSCGGQVTRGSRLAEGVTARLSIGSTKDPTEIGDLRKAPANCFRNLDSCQHLDPQAPEGMHYSPSRDQARGNRVQAAKRSYRWCRPPSCGLAGKVLSTDTDYDNITWLPLGAAEDVQISRRSLSEIGG